MPSTMVVQQLITTMKVTIILIILTTSHIFLDYSRDTFSYFFMVQLVSFSDYFHRLSCSHHPTFLFANRLRRLWCQTLSF